MTNKNKKESPLWQRGLTQVKKWLEPLHRNFEIFSLQYPNLLRIIQLTFLYLFAVIDLIHNVLSPLISFGYFPELLLPFYPVLDQILQSPILRTFASPEKMYFVSHIIIEFTINRSLFNFSKLLKYNILLIFGLLMIQTLIICYWDFIFNREVISTAIQWYYEETQMFVDKTLGISVYFSTFFIFLFAYIYLYVQAIRGKFGIIPYMEWFFDSIAFWLRIKTPTMRFGKGKGKKDKRK